MKITSQQSEQYSQSWRVGLRLLKNTISNLFSLKKPEVDKCCGYRGSQTAGAGLDSRQLRQLAWNVIN